MNKEQLIQLIEHELVQADEAQDEQQFEKHMYAIHTLTSLYSDVSKRPSKKSKHDFTNIVTSESLFSNKPSNHSAITAAEIEAMGGKVPQTMKHQNKSSNMMVTDDEIGNGESIFDF
ncbi:DUF5327 family protein [Staphylococcus hominis]|uniref:DUF5327 family protein n=1 Tax=Staphylococcus hominis TaxID=1290 RepID=UPI001D1442DF|nr:DUF5327 family protein [Staphylococcus hominis]MCC3736084.1 YwdI family protein [Staphylococcus hominis]